MDTASYLHNASQSTPQPVYEHGFLVNPASTVLFNEIPPPPEGYVSLTRLEHFARSLYPDDYDFAPWTWKILLRDMEFFELMYESKITGRQYQLDIRHVATHQTREEWLRDERNKTNDFDIYDALLDPYLWIIGKDSLKSQYHLLYVHDVRDDGYNRCRDWGTKHTTHVPKPRERERYAQQFGQSEQMKQARVQGHTVCVYALIRLWVLTCL
ncbi:MAG TPA: hypothetical protein VFM68_01880 [Candidatus Saccharimonadales bacterium]|nr:hypothetical protein [Candidatus Saccharimonadales bacterium]